MNTQTIVTAASIVRPVGGDFFQGTLAEATSAMVAYAAEMRADYGGGATSDLIKRLRNSDPDRVAEIAAGALLDLAEARAEVDRAGNAPAALDAVLRLHVADSYGNCCECGGEQDPQGAPWPCLTVRDIRDALTKGGPR